MLSFSAAGDVTNVVDIIGGVMMGRPGPAGEVFRREGVSTSADLMKFLYGEREGADAMLRLSQYADVTQSGVAPKPEDFIAADFRLLTATTVGARSWKATDFSNEDVLRRSLKMLDRKPVFTNHDTQVENWAGIISEPRWQAAQQNGKVGAKVPAGINATLLIDTKMRPEIARGVLVGAINSNSVTVEFEWTPSHTFEREYDFLDRIGEMHSDGKMIRRVVTKITGYHETSLVWLGADPFAKMVGPDGQLVNVDKGHVSYSNATSEEKDSYKQKHRYHIASGYEPSVVRLALETRNNPATPTMKPEVVAAILAMLSITEAEKVTPEDIAKLQLKAAGAAASADQGRFQKVIPMTADLGVDLTKLDEAGVAGFAAGHKIVTNARFAALSQAEIDLNAVKAIGDTKALKDEVTSLTAANEALKATAAIGDEYVTNKRIAVTSLYKKSLKDGTTPDASVVELIGKADSKALDGLFKQYSGTAVEKFAPTCTKCGDGAHVEFRSSIHVQEDAPKPTSASFSERLAEKRQRPLSAGSK